MNANLLKGHIEDNYRFSKRFSGKINFVAEALGRSDVEGKGEMQISQQRKPDPRRSRRSKHGGSFKLFYLTAFSFAKN